MYYSYRQISHRTARFGERWLPPTLYHWTEAINAPLWKENGYQRNGIYLTQATDPHTDWNPDVPSMRNPLRVAINTAHLDPNLFGYDDVNHEGYPGDPAHSLSASGNVYYKGPVPREAVQELKKFKAHPNWDTEFMNPESLGYSEWSFA